MNSFRVPRVANLILPFSLARISSALFVLTAPWGLTDAAAQTQSPSRESSIEILEAATNVISTYDVYLSAETYSFVGGKKSTAGDRIVMFKLEKPLITHVYSRQLYKEGK